MSATLPIRRIVLYKHGIGYFEREGPVSGSTPVQLNFKQREVSDVLKSLTVLDLDGGIVSAVSYDSTTPIEQLLAEIALSIPDAGSLVGLLPQLKGARIQVRPVAAAAPTVGALLGIDTVDTVTEHGLAQQVRVSILTDAADVLTFDLFDLELRLLDEGIRRDLDFYLKTQLASKKKDTRTFTLFTQGDGERTLRASYGSSIRRNRSSPRGCSSATWMPKPKRSFAHRSQSVRRWPGTNSRSATSTPSAPGSVRSKNASEPTSFPSASALPKRSYASVTSAR